MLIRADGYIHIPSGVLHPCTKASSYYQMGGHGMTLLFQPITVPDQKPSVALADLPIDEEYCLLKHISLAVEARQDGRKTWLSQSNYIMDKSGLRAGKVLSK
jgi:hypothetical protein